MLALYIHCEIINIFKIINISTATRGYPFVYSENTEFST